MPEGAWSTVLTLFALLGASTWLALGCPAKFDPLPDDDSAADDDSASDDDDTGDDDTSDNPLFAADPFQLDEGGIYTVFLLGRTDTDMNARWVQDVSLVTTPDQHSVRFVHGAASQSQPIQVCIDGTVPTGLEGMMPGSIWPDEFMEGYGNFGTAVEYTLDVFPTGGDCGDTGYGLVEGEEIDLYAGSYYTMVFTGRPQFRFVTLDTDDMSEITIKGRSRLRVYHSVEDLGALDVKVEIATGAPVTLGQAMVLGDMSNAAMVSSGMVTLKVYEAGM